MTKISCVFILTALLLCSDLQTAVCQRTDHRNPVLEISHHGNEATDEQGPLCGVCKKVIQKLIAVIGKHKDEAGQKLDVICEKIKIPGCKTFVKKFKAKLIAVLSVEDNERNVCVKLKLCKPGYRFLM